MIVVVLSNKAFEPGNYSPFIFSWLLPTCRGSDTVGMASFAEW